MALPVQGSSENPDIRIALTDLRQRWLGNRLTRNYYRGTHAPVYSTVKWREIFSDLFDDLSDNLCGSVVDSVVDRMVAKQWVDRTGADPTLAAKASVIAKRNRLDELMREVHTEAGANSDAFVIVGNSSDGKAVIYSQRADQCYVHYDEDLPGRILWAAKMWQSGNNIRLTLLYPDRIEKYEAEGVLLSTQQDLPPSLGGFTPVQDATDDEWPLLNPFGRVQMFHFPANSGLGTYGTSDLHNVIPLQNALNKSLMQAIVASEFAAYPQRYGIGIEDEYDADGNIVPFVPGVNRIWTVASELAKFGQFDPADIEKFIAEQNNYRTEIGAVSRTPLHYLGLQTGEIPSGEALRTIEAPFVAKVRARMTTFGNVWEDILAFAIQIEESCNEAGEFIGLAPLPALELTWQDPSSVAEAEKDQRAATFSALGVPLEVILVEVYGFDPDRAQLIADAKAATDALKAEQQLAAFAAGTPLGAHEPPPGPAAQPAHAA